MFRPKATALSLFDRDILKRAIVDSFRKLVPQHIAKNPVMFVVEIGSVLTTLSVVRDLLHRASASAPLWFTGAVYDLALVHGPVRELRRGGRRRARQGAGRHAAEDAQGDEARRLGCRRPAQARKRASPSSSLRKGDLVVIEAGELIPGDGEVIEGIASVDESAITGESAPVIRESGGDRSAVTGGTKVLSDRIVVRIGVNPGESFLDRMIGLVEGRLAPEDAQRDRAAHPAGRPDAGVPVRVRDAGAARDVLDISRCRRRSSSRCWCA